MARAPRKSPRNRLDPLRSRKVEQKVERQESMKKGQARVQDQNKSMKKSQKLQKGSHRWPTG